jgi:3-phytase
MLQGCKEAAVQEKSSNEITYLQPEVLVPNEITDSVMFDTDDPAIWINTADRSKSLIVGTDKEEGGGVYVFDLFGKIVNKVTGLKRPNNIDIAYQLNVGGKKVDIAVFTERKANTIRVFSMPDFKAIDGGGIPIFEGETCDECREGMGLALYTAKDGKIYAIVGRKNGPDGSYLWQYELNANANGVVKGNVIRKFGAYSGKKEIEAIAVDNELGYIYYSDETHGIRKYYADPTKGNEELAMFGTKDFARDHEGISIYKKTDSTGYILVSNQQDNSFMIYPREGSKNDLHEHLLITKVKVSTASSDGSDVSSLDFGNKFPFGFFVAMSENRVFHIYDWRDFQMKIDAALKN